jgi:hypothetical protein
MKCGHTSGENFTHFCFRCPRPTILILDFFEKIFPPEPIRPKKKVHYSNRIGFLSRRTMLQHHSQGHNENCCINEKLLAFFFVIRYIFIHGGISGIDGIDFAISGGRHVRTGAGNFQLPAGNRQKG